MSLPDALTVARAASVPFVVLLYAWNEIGEGGAILPTKGDGGAYALALQLAFTSAIPPTC